MINRKTGTINDAHHLVIRINAPSLIDIGWMTVPHALVEYTSFTFAILFSCFLEYYQTHAQVETNVAETRKMAPTSRILVDLDVMGIKMIWRNTFRIISYKI
jgi:hypothetical protein